ncbi:MAG: TonB family protein [Aquificaceae bacterium]
MDIKIKAYSLSLLLHFSLLSLFLLFAKSPLQEKKMIEIDLSLSYIVQEREERPQEVKQTLREERPREKRVLEAQKNSTPHTPKEEKAPKEKMAEAKSQEAPVIPQKESISEAPSLSDIPQPSSTQTKSQEAPVIPQKESGTNSGDKGASDSKGTIDPKQAQSLYLREKLSIISSIVQGHISYPPLARRMGWEGRVIVCFTLTSEGRLEDIHIEKSSGYELLDKNAIETVKRVAHLFPKPPVDVIIKLPVNYRLE